MTAIGNGVERVCKRGLAQSEALPGDLATAEENRRGCVLALERRLA
jgi:hypothetical protein